MIGRFERCLIPMRRADYHAEGVSITVTDLLWLNDFHLVHVRRHFADGRVRDLLFTRNPLPATDRLQRLFSGFGFPHAPRPISCADKYLNGLVLPESADAWLRAAISQYPF